LSLVVSRWSLAKPVATGGIGCEYRDSLNARGFANDERPRTNDGFQRLYPIDLTGVTHRLVNKLSKFGIEREKPAAGGAPKPW